MTDSTESVNQTNSNLQQASRPASDIPNASADEEGHTDQEEIPFRDGVTFDEFVSMVKQKMSCEEYGPTGRVPNLQALKTKYRDSYVWKIKQFNNLTDHYYYVIVNEMEEFAINQLLRDYINEFKRMDAFLNQQRSLTKRAKEKLLKDVKKIHNTMRKYMKKIELLDKAEISLDQLDDVNNPHFKKEKYEKRFANLSKKLLQLQGASSFSLRLISSGINYNGTDYPDINREVVRNFKSMMTNCRPRYSTPKYEDYLCLVKKVKEEKNLAIDDEEALAAMITEQVAEEVKNRRAVELFEMWDDYLLDERLIPQEKLNLEDPELLNTLKKNEEVNEESIRKLKEEIKERADAQETAGSQAVTVDDDLESDSADDEDEEDEDKESNGLDDLSPDSSDVDESENLNNLKEMHTISEDSPELEGTGSQNEPLATNGEEKNSVVNISSNGELSKNTNSQAPVRRQSRDSPIRDVKRLKTMSHSDVNTSLEISEAASSSGNTKDDIKKGPEIHSIEDDEEDFVDSSGNPSSKDDSDDDCIILD